METSNLEVLVTKELPVYKFQHPYGSIAIYHPSNEHISPERILLLLEQAKFDLLSCRIVSTKKPDEQ